MDTDTDRDADLVARLRQLEAGAGDSAPAFGYDAMLDRHAAKQRRARRQFNVARGAASALMLALVVASVWRVDRPRIARHSETAPATAAVHPMSAEATQPRIVRADSYLALATIEDHIAALDEALNEARARSEPAEVSRLERTRAELLDSYVRVRYADLLSANL